MLRYYEDQGLITPRRLDNGYRVYDEYLVDRIRKIRGLIGSGIPTRIIGYMLPCLDGSEDFIVDNPDPELQRLLAEERDRMTQKIELLIHHRDALSNYIGALVEAKANETQGPRESGNVQVDDGKPPQI